MPTPSDAAPYALTFISAAVLAWLGYLFQRWLKNRPAAPSIPEMWKRLDEQDDRIREQAERISKLEWGRQVDKQRMAVMEDHVAELESLVPNPPGPPPRPWMISHPPAQPG